MKHWAARVIRAGYEAGASGPDTFDCLGLVRYYFRERHGKELPDYKLHEGDERALLAFIRATGWLPVKSAEVQEDDVVTMQNYKGKHVGVMVQHSEGLDLLHAQGSGNVGGIYVQPLPTLLGYNNIRIWRSPC